MNDDLPANDASLRSFVDVAPDSHFPIQNLPFGIFSTPGRPQPRVGVAIGNQILDLAMLETAGLLRVGSAPVFQGPDLNDFIALGPAVTRSVRLGISRLLRRDNPTLASDGPLRDRALVAAEEASLHLPIRVGGFTDFMLSREHSSNCIDILGGTQKGELWRNWRHLPMGYNGRASSVVVGGTPIRRPSGQTLESQGVSFGATRKLDFELEAAVVVGKPVPLDSPAPIAEAEGHVFGLVLLNDWSARDIQAWESQPLGPFLGKGFRTSISPWIVTLDALGPFRTPGPEQNPQPLAHLRQSGARNFRVHMQASIRPQSEDASVVCRSRLEDLYWSIAQQVSHHTSAGCNLDTGDLLGTGTVSSTGPGAQGCLYEATRDGKVALELERGGRRTYLEDGDEVELTGWCEGNGYRVGFGMCTGRILPAVSHPA